MEDSQIIDLYWARLEQAIQETDTKYGGYCPCDCPQYFEEHGRQRGMRVGYMAARLGTRCRRSRPSVLSAFLGRITRNLSLDRYKAARAEKRGGSSFPAALDELSECVPAGGSVEQTMDERELGQAIDRFLRTIPEKQCSLFLRRYWYAESISQIAERYSLKENTVKSILFRTREQLRKFLQKEGVAV